MVTWSEHCRFQLSESLQPYSFTWLLPFCHMAIGNSPWMQVSASETHGTQWRNFQPAMLDDTEAHGLGPAMIPPKMVSLVTVRSSRFIPWISTDIPIKHTHTYIYYIYIIYYIYNYIQYIYYTQILYIPVIPMKSHRHFPILPGCPRCGWSRLGPDGGWAPGGRSQESQRGEHGGSCREALVKPRFFGSWVPQNGWYIYIIYI